MSTERSFPITVPRIAAKRRPLHQVKAVAAPSGMSIRAKMIIAGVVVVFALLYAKGVTLMIDAADTPNSYATFLHRTD